MIRALGVAAAITVAAVDVAAPVRADPYDELWSMLPAGGGPALGQVACMHSDLFHRTAELPDGDLARLYEWWSNNPGI